MTRLWAAWEAWAQSADRSEPGWESSFPQWAALMDAAKQSLLIDLAPAALRIMENCWAASHENEELLDFARDRIVDCWPNVAKLAESPLGACRWQVYAVAPAIGRSAEGMLRRGLEDEDGYARRRAALALASLAPADAESIARELARDPDPYIRQAAVEMALSSPDREVHRTVYAILSKDDVEHVRIASETLSISEPTIDDDALLRELRRRVPAGVAVASEKAVATCERELALQLPRLLRRIYLEVADGGVGPGYGLLPVTALADVCSQFRAEGWPVRLLPLWDWGDAIWSCIDVDKDNEIVTSDGVGRTATGIGLGEWLDAWLRGEDLWKKIYADQVRPIINPFTKKPVETFVRGKAIGRPWP